MASPRLENGVQNGSFLVLNLGSNTVRLGNSCMFPMPPEAFHQMPTLGTSNLDTISNCDTVSNSSEEALETSGNEKSKRKASKNFEDPDWVPKMKLRKSSNSTCRTTKPKPGPAVSKDPPGILAGGGNSMPGTRSGPPPPHLVNLLKFFSWRVLFRPSDGDYMYISPTGVAYHSLPKAFETFLHSTSRYKKKGWSVTQFWESRGPSGDSVQVPPSSLGQQSRAAVDCCREGEKAAKIVDPTVGEKMVPGLPAERPLELTQDYIFGNSKKPSHMPEKAVSQGVNQLVSSCRVTENPKLVIEGRCMGNESMQLAGSSSLTTGNGQRCDNDTCQDGKLPGVRRSRSSGKHAPVENEIDRRPMRVSGKHVPVEREIDITGTNGNSLHFSACEVSGDAVKGKSEGRSATSHAICMLQKKPEARMTEKCLNTEVGKSNHDSLGVVKRSDKSSRNCMYEDSNLVAVRRSRRVNKKEASQDQQMNAETMVDNSLASAKSVDNMCSRKDEGEPLVSGSVLDGQSHCNMNGGSLSSEAKRLVCGSTSISRQTDVSDLHCSSGKFGIRRSTRINGKRVPVDDDLDTEIGPHDDFFDLSEFALSRMVKKDKEKLLASFSGVSSVEEGRNRASNNMQLKQTYGKKSECSKSKTQKQLESQTSKKSEKAKKPGSERTSILQKEKLVGGGNSHKKRKKKRNRACSLVVRRTTKEAYIEEVQSQTKLTLLSWLIDSGTLTENQNLLFISKNHMGNIPSGLVTRGGIWCDCCKEVLPLSKFVVHSGSDPHQSWDNIFLVSGKTLMQCLKEAWEKEMKRNRVGFQAVTTDGPDPSDDTCGICAEGGHLICCDGCPSTFHQDCLMLKILPEGSWYCPYCRCTFCMAVEHGLNRALETMSLLTCKQCGRKYHQKCVWGDEMHEMGSVQSSFCGKICEKLASRLSEMLGVANPVEGGFSWTLLKHIREDEGDTSNERLSFILKCNVKLSMALFVLNECFVPLMDPRTGLDMICQAVYNRGSNFKRLSCEGFYTLILEKDEEIVSVASLRFHGSKFAEMPFVGTRPLYQRQGMCRRLVRTIQDMLTSLEIEKLIIPAIPDLLDTWMTSFSFRPLESSVKDEIRNLSMVIFAETTLLQKSISHTAAVAPEDDMPNSNNVMQKTHELSSSFIDHRSPGGYVAGGQDWWNHVHGRMEHKDITPDHWSMRRNSGFSTDPTEIVYQNMPNGSVSESLTSQSTFISDLESVPQSLAATPFSASVNMFPDGSSVGEGIISLPNREMDIWMQSVDEAKDAHNDAVLCTISFDSFFRTRS